MRSIMKMLSGALLFAVAAIAQPPVKPVPAAGIEVSTADRAELQSGLVIDQHVGQERARLEARDRGVQVREAGLQFGTIRG